MNLSKSISNVTTFVQKHFFKLLVTIALVMLIVWLYRFFGFGGQSAKAKDADGKPIRPGDIDDPIARIQLEEIYEAVDVVFEVYDSYNLFGYNCNNKGSQNLSAEIWLSKLLTATEQQLNLACQYWQNKYFNRTKTPIIGTGGKTLLQVINNGDGCYNDSTINAVSGRLLQVNCS